MLLYAFRGFDSSLKLLLFKSVNRSAVCNDDGLEADFLEIGLLT